MHGLQVTGVCILETLNLQVASITLTANKTPYIVPIRSSHLRARNSPIDINVCRYEISRASLTWLADIDVCSIIEIYLNQDSTSAYPPYVASY